MSQDETAAPLTHSEALGLLSRALCLVNEMASEGIAITGCEDPCDMMSEFAQRMGVADDDDCWNASLTKLQESIE